MEELLVDGPGFYRLWNGKIVYVFIHPRHDSLCGPGELSTEQTTAGIEGKYSWWYTAGRYNSPRSYSGGHAIRSKYRIDPRHPRPSLEVLRAHFYTEPWW